MLGGMMTYGQWPADRPKPTDEEFAAAKKRHRAARLPDDFSDGALDLSYMMATYSRWVWWHYFFPGERLPFRHRTIHVSRTPTMTPVRLALIGYGKWGRNYVRAARESGEAEVTHVVLRDASFQSNIVDGINACSPFFAAGACDAVVYAGPPASAAPFCEYFLGLGKAIMTEKPAGLSLADAERIAAAEAASKAFVLVNHQHLFSEAIEAMRLRVADSTSVRAQAVFAGPVARDYPVVWDYGPHAVSCAIALLGNSGLAVGRKSSRSDQSLFDVSTTRGIVLCWASHTPDGRRATVDLFSHQLHYNGYAPTEPPLTRSVRAFARAVRAGGTDDWRFGARWAVDVARVLESTAP